MPKYSAIIVEDDTTTRFLIEDLISQSERFEVIASYASALEALNSNNINTCDVIFLDVEMPGLNGLDLARRIDSNAKIVITTSEKKYAIDAFGVHAFDFILKPVDIPKLLDIAQRLDDTPSSSSEKPIFLKTKEGHVRIDLNEVLAVSAERDYVFYHTKDKRHIARQSMSKVLELSNGYSFIQVHRSYIINLDHVSSFSNDIIVLDQMEVPLSRSFKEAFLLRINKIV